MCKILNSKTRDFCYDLITLNITGCLIVLKRLGVVRVPNFLDLIKKKSSPRARFLIPWLQTSSSVGLKKVFSLHILQRQAVNYIVIDAHPYTIHWERIFDARTIDDSGMLFYHRTYFLNLFIL